MAQILKVLATALLLAAWLLRAAAAGELMTADQMRGEFDGHSITGYYTRDHIGFIEVYLGGGGIEYNDTEGSDTGKWSIAGGAFCTFYDHMSGACWYVVKEQPNCYEFYDAGDFGGEAATPGSLLKHEIRARAARDGGRLTCEPWVGS